MQTNFKGAVAGLLLGLSGVGYADDSVSGTLFYTELSVESEYHYQGRNPPIDGELIAKLAKENEQAASGVCRKLLGEYTLLQLTQQGEIQQSILTYMLPATYLCGRSVN